MAWKGVHLSRPARLSLKDNQIVVAQDDGDVHLPLEDIAWIVLDTAQASLTTGLLSAAMEAGIVIVATDARHTPNGVMLPFHAHHRQAGVAAVQLATTAAFRKRCWRAIVVAKIDNQAAVLARLGRPPAGVKAMAAQVGSGDPDNVEARAARAYWPALFDGFIRANGDDLRNKLLNYGYAVVRAAVARALVACGLLPGVGLHHAGVTNAFNLADDMVEPFRPVVDLLVEDLARDRPTDGDPTLEDRRALAGILTRDCRLGRECMTLLAATERCVESLVRAMEGNTPALLRLPQLDPAGETP